jgi:hypothetical protein
MLRRRTPLGRLRLGEQVDDPETLGRDPAARVRDHALFEAEPLRRLQRVRGPRPAERDPVERLVCLRIQPGGRVRGPVGRARPLLQLRMVRGRDRQPCLAGQPRHERLREGRPLDRVGAGGQLVHEDKRPLRRRAEDPDEVRDVPGEGREAHLDRLLVADVGKHLVEHGESRLRGRRAQPGLVEERSQPERLQRNGLAAGVRPADHQRAQRAEVEVDRHGG